MSGKFHEVGVVTERGAADDVCCGDAVPEVELVSLVSEQLPRYRLRADTMTEFAGYSHRDWTQCAPGSGLDGDGGGGGCAPQSRPEAGDEDAAAVEDEDLDLSPLQIEHLLDYFILCGLRVSQMTQTYDDIGAVTQLLEEKERDLEMAATIGKQLLEKNKHLETQVEVLEEQLRQSNEEVRQLRHQLGLKNDLLRIYVEDAEEMEADDDSSADLSALTSLSSSSSGFVLSRAHAEKLERKVKELQAENLEMRSEKQTMLCSAETFENKEQLLVKDILEQLKETNARVRLVSEDLTKKTDKCMQQQEEITGLLARNIELEARVKQLLADNELLQQRFRDSDQVRAGISGQLGELRDRYDECLALLSEAQTESRDLRRRQRRHLRQSLHSVAVAGPGPGPSLGASDLASELALAERRGSQDATEAGEDDSGSVRVMGAVKQLRQWQLSSSRLAPSRHQRSLSSATSTNQDNTSAAVRTTDLYSCSSVSGSSLAASAWDDDGPPPPPLPVPAPVPALAPALPTPASSSSGLGTATTIPGSASFSPPEAARAREREAELSCASFLSTGSEVLGGGPGSSAMVQSWLSAAPEKLQIVKPIEGSLTLRQWQHLATPSLSRALFESPPAGVHVRGSKSRIARLEEDEDDTAYSEVEEDDGLGQPRPSPGPTRAPAAPPRPHSQPAGRPSSQTSPHSSSSSSCFSHPEHSARMARHNISGLSPGLARLLCERGIHSQAAMAVVAAPPGPGPGPGPGPPPLIHAHLLESIHRVGNRLWQALSLAPPSLGDYGYDDDLPEPGSSPATVGPGLNLVPRPNGTPRDAPSVLRRTDHR